MSREEDDVDKLQLGDNAPVEPNLAKSGASVISTLLGTLPFPFSLLGAISPLLTSYDLEQLGKRVAEFGQAVNAKIDLLGFKLQRLTDGQQDHFVRILREVELTAEAERLARLANAAARVLVEDVDDVWFTFLSDCVRQLSPTHVAILEALYAMPKTIVADDTDSITLEMIGPESDPRRHNEELSKLPGPVYGLIMRKLSDLGLIGSVGTSKNGVSCVHYSRTIEGRKFRWFISDPSSPTRI